MYEKSLCNMNLVSISFVFQFSNTTCSVKHGGLVLVPMAVSIHNVDQAGKFTVYTSTYIDITLDVAWTTRKKTVMLYTAGCLQDN